MKNKFFYFFLTPLKWLVFSLFTILTVGVNFLLAEVKLPHVTVKSEPAVIDTPSKDGGSTPELISILWLIPEKGWNTYAPSADSTGQTTKIEASLDPSGKRLVPLFPPGIPKQDPSDPSITFRIYDSPTPVFFRTGLSPANATGQSVNFRFSLLMCTDVNCVPVKGEEKLDFNLSDTHALPKAETSPWFSLLEKAGEAEALIRDQSGADAPAPKENVTDKSANLAAPPVSGKDFIPDYSFSPQPFSRAMEVEGLTKALIFAFLAGLILNLMPCVLPVISLKIVTFFPRGTSPDDKEAGKRLRRHSMFFALGIVVYFMLLAVMFSTVEMAWGELFQNTKAIMIITAFLFALSLSLFGILDLPVIAPRIGISGKKAKSQHFESFFNGVFVTLLATPCSGPFLGGVLAWTVLQPPQTIALTFLFVGLGMSSPYLVFSVYPGLVKLFPKPGAWNLYMEKAVGFLLGATCLYLIYILPANMHFPMIVLIWATSVGAWAWGQWTNLSQPRIKRISIRLAAILFVVMVGYFAIREPGSGTSWKPFSEPQFSSMLGKELILVDFTADWCPTCKVLEKTVLTDGNLQEWKSRYKASFVKVDMTREEANSKKLLSSLNSLSIPVIAIFPKGENYGKPIVIRDLATAGMVQKALEQAYKPD